MGIASSLKKVATKGLSKLGFNADVFMGKFDDNKYVDSLANKYGVDKKETPKPKQNKSSDLDI